MSRSAPRAILYILNSSALAGANRSLAVLLSGLDRSRFRPLAVVPRDGPVCRRLHELEVPIHTLPLASLARLRAGPIVKLRAAARNSLNTVRLAAVLRHEDVRLVHTNTIFPLTGALVAKALGRPHVWHVREGMDWPGYALRFGRPVSRWLVGALSRRIICISDYVRQVSVAAGARERALVVPNALEEVPPMHAAPNLNAPVIGLVGVISRQKRTDIFVEAAARVAARLPGARFIVAGRPTSGEEPFADACRERATALGLGNRMLWPGQVEDTAGLFAGLDLLIHTGVHEGFGRVLMEAMAHGIPVVSVRSGAAAEIVDDPATGRLVEPNDVAALAAAALDLLGDPDRYRRTATAARRYALARFDPARHVQAVTAVYEALLGPATGA